MPLPSHQILSATDIPCPACGYDLRGTIDAERCPECGAKLYPFELTERRNLQADAIADDCRYMAPRDVLLLLVFAGSTFACFFDWRIGVGAIVAGLVIVNLLLSADQWLDPGDSGLFDRLDYAFGHRASFREARTMLKFPGLHQKTRSRLIRWFMLARTILLLQVLSLVIYVCLLIWSITR